MLEHPLLDWPALREVKLKLHPTLGFHLTWLREPAPFGFTLGYTDCRRLSHWPENLDIVLRAYGLAEKMKPWLEAHRAVLDGGFEVSLSLSVPGEQMWVWLDAPGKRDPDFFAAYSAVSVALQRALRRWLPYAYFSDPNRYDDPLAAWPLLVYAAMPPFPPKPKYEFTCDIMDLGAASLIRRSTLRELTARLTRLRPFLIALGKRKTARFFAPDEAPSILATVARQPRLLNALFSAETFFVEALVDLGLRGHALTDSAARQPAQAARDWTRFAGGFVTAFHRRLRRLYAGQDFFPLGTLLLIEATRALAAARGREAPLRAILRLAAGGVEQTFANPGWAP
jgi:hypothetical protein